MTSGNRSTSDELVPHQGIGVEACAGRAATSATKAASVASPSFTRDTVLTGGKERVKAGRYDDRMAATETLESLLRDSFPDASELAVEDRTGGGDHFQVTIASGRFEGLSLVEQHRLVYEALAAPLGDGSIHELRIKTRGQA